MKQIKHFLLTLAMLLCSTSLFAVVNYDFKVGGICYDITSETDNTVRVTYNDYNDYYIHNYYTKYSGTVTIPESVTYNGTTYSVTSIGSYAFYDCDGLTSVTIPNSVTSIDSKAFSSCSGLTSVTIPNSVTSIGNSAFSNCYGLTSVIIPNSMTSIGESAFSYCSGLTSVTIGNSVTSIGGYAFAYCSGLTSVTIPNSVTSIGESAFDNTAWYNNKPDGLVYINNVLYKYKGTMPSGTTVEIKEGTISISPYAFYNCYGLTSVTIPNSVTSIGENAFDGTAWYNNLPDGLIYNGDVLLGYKGDAHYDELFIREGTVTIAPNALKKVVMNAVYIPASVVNVDPKSFGGFWLVEDDSEYFTYCSYPENIIVDPNNPVYSSHNGALYNKDQTILYDCPSGKREFSMSSKTKTIHPNAFSDCEWLRKIQISSNITSIPEGTFKSCGLNLIECKALVPPSITNFEKTFAGTSFMLYIPTENIEAYEETDWSRFVIQPLQEDNCKNLEYVYTGNNRINISYDGEDDWHITFEATKGEVFSCRSDMRYFGDFFTKSIKVNGAYANVEDNYYSNEDDYSDSFKYIIMKDGLYTIDIHYSGDLSDVSARVYDFQLGVAKYTQKEERLHDWKSPSTNNNSKSMFQYEFNADSGSVLSFDWSTSTESTYDVMYCEVDGKNILTKSGIADGTCTYTINSSGAHNLTIVYSKDASVSKGDDQVEIKNIYIRKDISDNNYIEEVNINESILSDNFSINYQIQTEKINYKRTFNNTEWQALYVPFAMSYDDWKEDFDVAKINDIHQFDVNNDGDFDDAEDKTIMEMLKVNSGTLKANHPYMIRAKSTGEKSITIENATLMPTEVNSIDCSSVERKYVFTGTYNTIDGETMVNNKYYAMSGGGVKYTTSTSVSLKPFRWYMQIMDRDGQLLESAAEIKVVVSGEDDWDVTGIESVKDGDGTFKVYSIGGVLVRSVKAADIKQATEGLPKGLYIINGKKCNVR